MTFRTDNPLGVHDAVWVLMISGVLGFRVGMTGFPDWQVAVETAQVVAGVVEYPSQTPFYIYHTQVWTILHHLLAVGLRAGISELTLSLIVSGVLGMVTFQALAMFVYALARNVPIAIGSPALIFFTRSAEYGTVYPLFLLGVEHTYGVIGLSASVLTVALLGAGWSRTGAMLLGVLPCIHPTLGAWTGAVVALAILSGFRQLRDELRPAIPWFLAGCAVTLASLLVQLTLIYEAPQNMGRLSPGDFSTFIRLWDSHRASVDLRTQGVLLNVACLILSCAWLRFFSSEWPRSARLLLRISAAGALLALAMVPLSWIPPDRMPTAVLVLMPARFLNFAAMTFVAMVIGLLTSRREPWSRAVLLVFLSGLLVSDRSWLWQWLQQPNTVRYSSRLPPQQIVWMAVAGLVAGAAWSSRRARTRAHAGLASRVLLALSVGVLATLAIITWNLRHPRSVGFFADRTNDVFFSEVAAHSGILLLAGDLRLIQLKTRRPVLIDSSALDTIMYSLETGSAVTRIMREVYGLDLFNPPASAIGAGRIPPLAHRETWQRYSPDKWREIRNTFGVTQVLTYADWTIDLPVAADSQRLRLYDIPDQ